MDFFAEKTKLIAKKTLESGVQFTLHLMGLQRILQDTTKIKRK